MLRDKKNYYSIESTNPSAVYSLSSELIRLLEESNYTDKSIALLCIGTDRSTGDCLGPLIGYKLTSYYSLKTVRIYGTLNKPVHAKNLASAVEEIYTSLPKPLIIAADASLGKIENIGKINIFKGPLSPGSGVNKSLKAVGDISITGIVNMSGYMEYMVLQNTRLSVVMRMADIIALSLYSTLHNISVLGENSFYN